MSNFDRYIQYRALGVIYRNGYSLGDIEDQLESGALVITDDNGNRIDNPGLEYVLPVKNLCAKVPTALVDRIDEVIGLLQISKRDFVEMAVREAVERADKILEEEGVYSYLDAVDQDSVDPQPSSRSKESQA